MAGRAGHGLGEHAATAVEHGGSQVTGFPHAGGKRGAHQGLGLLFND